MLRANHIESIMRKLLLFTAFVVAATGVCHAEQYTKPSPEYSSQLISAHKRLIFSLAKRPDVIALLQQRQQCVSSLEEIIKKDRQWPLATSLRDEVTGNDIAKEFRRIIGDKKYGVVELMLVDGLGGLVAAYPAPSDFWQADEPKFYEAIQRSDAYVSDASWDHSTNTYSFFVGLPVYTNGEIQGVLIAGLDISMEYMMQMSLEDLIQLKGF